LGENQKEIFISAPSSNGERIRKTVQSFSDCTVCFETNELYLQSS
jgi:hypothetical protein